MLWAAPDRSPGIAMGLSRGYRGMHLAPGSTMARDRYGQVAAWAPGGQTGSGWKALAFKGDKARAEYAEGPDNLSMELILELMSENLSARGRQARC